MLRYVILIFPFFIISLLAGGQIPDAVTLDKIALAENKHFINKALFTENKKANETDFIYQRMEWEIDPNHYYISGEITTWFASKKDSLSEIYFDLYEDLQVDSITQRGNLLSFSRNSNQVIIKLPYTLSEDQIDSVSVFYQGIPHKRDYGSFTKSTHGEGSVPVIWTLSEPYGAMDWWPCKQSLADKIDSIDIIVTSPEIYRTASNGVLVSEQTESGKQIMHWKHRFPIAAYLVAIAVTNYVDYSDFVELEDGRKIEILNYVYPENLSNAQDYTPRTIEIMKLYNELIGEYPFAAEKYGHAQFGWSGGMEHQTMSFMGSFGFGLIAHELAHQWFGDYITLGSWQDIWLNEGFATYLTGLAYENLSPYWWPVWKKEKIDQITSVPGGSVFVNDTADVQRLFSSRLSYSKGAYLLHMLRWILGDEAFFPAIQNYFTDPEVANGFAQTSQVIKHFEMAGDTTLTEFFNDWFYGEGYPVYYLNYVQPKNDSLIIELSQTSSSYSVGFFEMPVPVRLYNSTKSDSLDIRLDHTSNNQKFIINPGFIVAEIIIDPDLWLISKTGTITGISQQSMNNNLVIYPNPVHDKLNLLFPSNQTINQIEIYSLSGNLIAQYNNVSASVPTKRLQPGVYILMAHTKEREYKLKFIKQ